MRAESLTTAVVPQGRYASATRRPNARIRAPLRTCRAAAAPADLSISRRGILSSLIALAALLTAPRPAPAKDNPIGIVRGAPGQAFGRSLRDADSKRMPVSAPGRITPLAPVLAAGPHRSERGRRQDRDDPPRRCAAAVSDTEAGIRQQSQGAGGKQRAPGVPHVRAGGVRHDDHRGRLLAHRDRSLRAGFRER